VNRRSTPLDRLVDAEPSFYDYSPDRDLNPGAGPDRRGVGVMFLCPIHEDCWHAVPFTNPLDGGGAFEPHRVSWDRDGDSFETLSLSPSIRRIPHGLDDCAWHGYVRAGRLETLPDSR